MKVFPAEIATILSSHGRRPRLGTLIRFLSFLLVMISAYALVFKLLMAREGQEQTWITAFYWVLTVMSTLGFGDITFHTDLGRLFSILVLSSGMLFLLVLLPFIFIEFFYEPWMEAQKAARTPRSLPKGTSGHVLLTHFDPVSAAFIRRLEHYEVGYVIVVEDVEEALALMERGYRVVVGELDDPATFEAVRAREAVLGALTAGDTINTSVAFTIRDVAPDVHLIATADDTASIDVLELAGCDYVVHLAEQMGRALARRISGGRTASHPVCQFGDLLFAEANASHTSLVGRTLLDSGLRDRSGVTVVGTWDRGRYGVAGPDTAIDEHSVLLLAGNREQLERYDEEFVKLAAEDQLVLILGGGRVGRAAGRALAARGIDYRIVERNPDRPDRDERWVIGNAADLQVLAKAGIERATSVMITTHQDDTNIYLTLYISKLRPKIQLLSRCVRERNVSSLHRAGADIVLSYASMGAAILLNALEGGDTVLVAEGLILFRVEVPPSLAGRTLEESAIRTRTGATLVAVESDAGQAVNPVASTVLESGDRLILIGDDEAESTFLSQFVGDAQRL